MSKTVEKALTNVQHRNNRENVTFNDANNCSHLVLKVDRCEFVVHIISSKVLINLDYETKTLLEVAAIISYIIQSPKSMSHLVTCMVTYKL